MLGQDVVMGSKDFQPYLPDFKEGYRELEQLKPGVVSCPFCNNLIDAKQSQELKATKTVVEQWPRSWASVPICKCSGVWAVYDPNSTKWAFRYKVDTGDNSWQR